VTGNLKGEKLMVEKQYKTIVYESGPITRMIHNEPEKRNALTGHFSLEFSDALKRFQRDRDAVVGVIGATGNVFSAGHNLEFVSKMDDWKPKEEKILSERDWREQMDFNRDNLYFPLYDCKKPIIAAVQGDVHAGATELIHMCDIVVAAETAVFSYAIARISGGGSANLFPYFLGFKKAAELYLTGGKITAPELERLGAINKVVPAAEVEAEAMRYAKIISLMPAETLKLIKQSLRFSLNRMGARDTIWFGCESGILGHLNSYPREKEFYTILKKKGMRAAVEFRDKPFKELGA
jgi:enoyl-CoA hydratase